MTEKIRCEYCGRKNDIDNDLCMSCGARLPDFYFPVLTIKHSLELDYLNELVSHSAFSMSIETGRLVGLR